ncbi:MAG: cytochrome c oxidase subunit II [Chloroflexota bacterium]
MEFSSTGERNRTIAVIAVVTVLLLIGGYFIAELTPWLMGEQASSQAQLVDGLMYAMMYIGGMVFLLVQGLILWAVIFYRRRKGDDSDGPNIHGNNALEFIWTLVPSIVVFVLTIYSYQVYVVSRAPQENELLVSVTARRYAFGFEYYDEATETVINDSVLRTYVEMDENGEVIQTRPVRLQLDGEDVIHSFWMPSMRVKQDMLPGRTTELRFTPIKPGRYPVVCTELCGGGHGGMFSEVLVYPSEESYMNWFETQVDCEVNPPEDPALRGRRLLETNSGWGCAGCHVLDDLGWAGQVGPSLNVIGDDAASRAAAAGNVDGEEYLYTSIQNSMDYIVPSYQGVMPQWQTAWVDSMSEDDISDITAYLLTLSSEPIEFAPSCPTPDFDEIMSAYNSGLTSQVATR